MKHLAYVKNNPYARRLLGRYGKCQGNFSFSMTCERVIHKLGLDDYYWNYLCRHDSTEDRFPEGERILKDNIFRRNQAKYGARQSEWKTESGSRPSANRLTNGLHLKSIETDAKKSRSIRKFGPLDPSEEILVELKWDEKLNNPYRNGERE